MPWPFSRVTPVYNPLCLLDCLLVRHASFLVHLWAVFPLLLCCPNAWLTFFIVTPAHPHATRVFEYLALFLFRMHDSHKRLKRISISDPHPFKDSISSFRKYGWNKMGIGVVPILQKLHRCLQKCQPFDQEDFDGPWSIPKVIFTITRANWNLKSFKL